MNGKLSAVDIERLGDVFLARQASDLQRIYSRRDGSLALTVQVLREELIRLLAIFDTAVDFVEEYSHVLHMASEPLQKTIHGCSQVIHRYSAFRAGGTVRKIVLAGRPNAGKSSLFNGLLCRYRAIVHSEPGTTRDVIEEDVELDGRLWKLVDTAGVRHAEGVAERQGIELGEDFLDAASFWILVVDGSVGLQPEEIGLLDRFRHKPHAIVWNKSDLAEWTPPSSDLSNAIAISAVEGDSFPRLWDCLRSDLRSIGSEEIGPLPSAVQAGRLQIVLRDLESLRDRMDRGEPPEYLSEATREAIGHLEAVIGEVGTEDVLDRIFNDFCIGK